jgi:hypothetical protein
MTKAKSDPLYESLIAEAENPRLKQSLERVKEACDFLEVSNASITPTSVGRYCEGKWGGPKAQSIRNQPEKLLRYVDTRKGQQKLPLASRRSGVEPIIHDETLRAWVSLLRAERDEAIRLKDRIVHGLRSVPGIPIDELIGNGFKSLPAARPTSLKAASPSAVSALKKLLNKDALAKVGLELHKDRIRNCATNDVLLEKAEVEALRGLVSDLAMENADLPRPQALGALK